MIISRSCVDKKRVHVLALFIFLIIVVESHYVALTYWIQPLHSEFWIYKCVYYYIHIRHQVNNSKSCLDCFPIIQQFSGLCTHIIFLNTPELQLNGLHDSEVFFNFGTLISSLCSGNVNYFYLLGLWKLKI